MPIPLTLPLLNPIAPPSATSVGTTHFDIYGSGGYRALALPGLGDTTTELNDAVPLARRTVGQLVYDTTSGNYYRCTATDPGAWTAEDFGGSGSVTSVSMTVPGGLTVDPTTINSSGTFGVEIDSTVFSGGLVKTDGASFSQATAGQDYAAASHEHVTGDITSVATNRLLGRSSQGTGDAEQITVSTGLTLSNGVLTAQGSGGTITGGSGDSTHIGVTTSGTNLSIAHLNQAGVVAGQYGGSQSVPVFTVDAKGHITSINQVEADGFLSTDGGTVNGSVTLSGSTSNLTVGGDALISGNLTVSGTTTTVDSTTVEIADKNITLAANATTDAQSTGGGITVLGTKAHTFNWLSPAEAWTSSENVEVVATKWYRADGANVLNKTTLGPTVTASSLQSVGTLGTGTWQADEIGLAYGGTGADLSSTSVGTILKVGDSGALVAANVDSDYLSSTSVIDGGSY